MIKKIPLASLYPQEKFLLSRTLTKVYEDFESSALPMADFSDTVFVLPSREAGRLFRAKAAQKFKIHGGVTSLKILLPEELAVTQTEIRTTQTVMLETFFDVLKKAKENRTFSDILPDVEYTDNTLLSYAEYLLKKPCQARLPDPPAHMGDLQRLYQTSRDIFQETRIHYALRP